MRRAGWEIHFIDLALDGSAPRAEIKLARLDGRWLWARLDALGRCTIETYHRHKMLGRPADARGRVPLSPQVDDVFLGRRSGFAGPRAMLRALTSYVVDNSLAPVGVSSFSVQ